MPSPAPWDDIRCDLDPPPKGSPALLGDKLQGLASFRRTVELRVGHARPAIFHRNLTIAAAVLQLGYTQREAAAFFGLSESRVSHILSEMESLIPPRDTTK